MLSVMLSLTGELSFQPHLFLEPLRSRMEFVETIVNTQFFMSFVEQQQVEWLAQEYRQRLEYETVYSTIRCVY